MLMHEKQEDGGMEAKDGWMLDGMGGWIGGWVGERVSHLGSL